MLQWTKILNSSGRSHAWNSAYRDMAAETSIGVTDAVKNSTELQAPANALWLYD